MRAYIEPLGHCRSRVVTDTTKVTGFLDLLLGLVSLAFAYILYMLYDSLRHSNYYSIFAPLGEGASTTLAFFSVGAVLAGLFGLKKLLDAYNAFMRRPSTSQSK